jgi:magnesium-transporting ATPase (P-type)
MAKPSAWVMRGGALMQVPIGEIVAGDIVRIEAGDRVPADGRLITGQWVMADESILTGELLPVDKGQGAELLSGTLLVRSKGYMVVADVVLQDDNFATIVTAIEKGRSIYENVQKFIRLLFSTDLALIALITSGLGMTFLLGLKDPSGGMFLLPLTAVQLLWINVVADGPPALALAFDRNPGVMARPPRPPGSKLLDAASLRLIAISAGAKAVGGIGLLAVMPWLGHSLD